MTRQEEAKTTPVFFGYVSEDFDTKAIFSLW